MRTVSHLDDIIIYSKTFDDHIRDLGLVFTRLKEANLKLKASKCHLCCDKVPYLGYVICKAGLQPDPQKKEKILNWPVPTSKQEIMSFIGLAGYYRKLIKAAMEHALRRLTRDEVEFLSTPHQQQAFEEIKKSLVSTDVLALPDFTKRFQFEVTTDASDVGIGAVLSQKGDDGKEKVVQYASRVLSTDELKYHTQQKKH